MFNDSNAEGSPPETSLPRLPHHIGAEVAPRQSASLAPPPPSAPGAENGTLNSSTLNTQASYAAISGGSNGSGGGLGGWLSSMGPRMLVIPIVIGALAVGAISNMGSTSAEDLAAGDCFLMTDADEIDRLDTPDCGDEHDSQIVAVVEVQWSEGYPDDFSEYWGIVYDRCLSEADRAITDATLLPPDSVLEMFTPVESGWDGGDRESVCYIHAPSGLNGSFVEGAG